MTWQPNFSNETPPSLTPAADHASIETGPGVVRCYNCGHNIWAHFQDGETGGCVANEPPALTLEAAVRGDVRKPFIGNSSCLCPGWTRGQLPHALTKHLTPVADGDAACTRCEHPLSDHSEEQGCHSCTCTIHNSEVR